MIAPNPHDPPSDEQAIEVIYPGKAEWSYVGQYHSENLARQRAEDQIRAEEAMQEARRFMKGSAA